MASMKARRRLILFKPFTLPSRPLPVLHHAALKAGHFCPVDSRQQKSRRHDRHENNRLPSLIPTAGRIQPNDELDIQDTYHQKQCGIEGSNTQNPGEHDIHRYKNQETKQAFDMSTFLLARFQGSCPLDIRYAWFVRPLGSEWLRKAVFPDTSHAPPATTWVAADAPLLHKRVYQPTATRHQQPLSSLHCLQTHTQPLRVLCASASLRWMFPPTTPPPTRPRAGGRRG